MGEMLTTTGKKRGLTLSPELLPESLQDALKTPDRLVFDGDQEVSAGMVTAPGIWQPPEQITPVMIGAARQYVRDYGLCNDPAPPELVLEWLARLSSGIPHNMAGRTLEMRLEALAEAVEDFPAYCWTKATRKRAAAQFTHVPASKELIGFAEAMAGEERERVRRLMVILDRGNQAAPAPEAKGEAPRLWNREIAEEHGRKLAERRRDELADLGRIMRERDAEAALDKPAPTVAEQIKRTAKAVKTMKPAPAEVVA